MTWSLSFKNEKRQGQRNQEQTGKIHRQKIHGVKCENQADTTDNTRSNHSRMREFGIQAKNTKNQEHKKSVWLDDPRQKLLPRRECKGRSHRTL